MVADDHDAMHVVGHHHERAEGDVWEMFRDREPTHEDNTAERRQSNATVAHVSERVPRPCAQIVTKEAPHWV
ncbi:MAG TPA: hypothetical protein VNL77_04405 [Roseiflexaceae bacterium]|nr:hypothetical protein [Roseiflexaceae bacterium]